MKLYKERSSYVSLNLKGNLSYYNCEENHRHIE